MAAERMTDDTPLPEIERMIRRLHYYGDPPDSRLQADVDGDVADIVDAIRHALAAERAKALEEIRRIVGTMSPLMISPRSRVALFAALEKEDK